MWNDGLYGQDLIETISVLVGYAGLDGSTYAGEQNAQDITAELIDGVRLSYTSEEDRATDILNSMCVEPSAKDLSFGKDLVEPIHNLIHRAHSFGRITQNDQIHLSDREVGIISTAVTRVFASLDDKSDHPILRYEGYSSARGWFGTRHELFTLGTSLADAKFIQQVDRVPNTYVLNPFTGERYPLE